MKQFLFCLTISLYGSILAVGQTTGTLTSHKFQSGGIERSYKYYQPANLSSGAPLVFVLHGYGGTADPKRFGMNPIADKYGFAVCYPQGEQDKKGKNCLIPSKELPTKPAQYILHGLLQWRRNVLSFSVQTSRYIYSSSSCCRSYARMDVSGIRNKPPYPSIRNTRNRRQNLYVERRPE